MLEYVAGEALCDEASRVAEGVRRLRSGMALAWELSQEVWPGWATAMYDRMLAGGPVDVDAPVPLLGSDAAWLQPDLSPLASAGPAGAWWRTGTALRAICGALRSRHFAVLDHFLPAQTCAALRGCCAAAWRDGILRPANVALPGAPRGGQQSIFTRSDCMAWVSRPAAPSSNPLSAPLSFPVHPYFSACRFQGEHSHPNLSLSFSLDTRLRRNHSPSSFPSPAPLPLSTPACPPRMHPHSSVCPNLHRSAALRWISLLPGGLCSPVLPSPTIHIALSPTPYPHRWTRRPAAGVPYQSTHTPCNT
jgi:hypothetical protein